MKISLSQIYIAPGISFPFSHLFQRRLSDELTAIVQPSKDFIRRYGDDFTVIFNMSAKAGIQELEIRGPLNDKKKKELEFTLFLPYDPINDRDDVIATALRYLITGIINVLESVGVDATQVLER